jgi:prepilin-type N-terminal cleavage/methylation domain-containing protein
MSPLRSSAPTARDLAHRKPGQVHRGLGEGGFTLLEIAVVVFIISAVAAIAVPALKQVSLEARSVAVANDLRVFSGALQAYVHDHGDWPAGNDGPGVFPPGMEGYLRQTSWERVTPIGGRYAWEPNSLQQGDRFRAVIVIASTGTDQVTTDSLQLEDLDRRLDDGDLTSGNFRLGYRNFPVYVLEH